MKITCLLIAAIVGIYATAQAAPVESIESARATVALQKVDAFFTEKAVVDQMTALGITQQQVQARLAQLTDAQMEQLAAQVDLLKSGGTIQGGGSRPLGPIGCVLRQVGITIKHVFQFVFCWTDVS